MKVSDLDLTSSAYDAMVPYWDKVAAIRGGTETMKEAAVSQNFLPKLPMEKKSFMTGESTPLLLQIYLVIFATA